jgi:hypothetical protein
MTLHSLLNRRPRRGRRAHARAVDAPPPARTPSADAASDARDIRESARNLCTTLRLSHRRVPICPIARQRGERPESAVWYAAPGPVPSLYLEIHDDGRSRICRDVPLVHPVASITAVRTRRRDCIRPERVALGRIEGGHSGDVQKFLPRDAAGKVTPDGGRLRLTAAYVDELSARACESIPSSVSSDRRPGVAMAGWAASPRVAGVHPFASGRRVVRCRR